MDERLKNMLKDWRDFKGMINSDSSIPLIAKDYDYLLQTIEQKEENIQTLIEQLDISYSLRDRQQEEVERLKQRQNFKCQNCGVMHKYLGE